MRRTLQQTIITVYIALVMLAFFSGQVLAQAAQQQYQTCIACHGDKGQGNEPLKAPALAGQHAWYLNKQLTDFFEGARGSHEDDANGKLMLPFASSLATPALRQSMADYLSSMPVVSADNNVSGDMKNGYRYYQAKCGACHGGKAEGNKVFNAPNLAILDSEYLMLQMVNFKNGVRGYKAEDKLGRQMAMMARTVSDKELNDIVFFISEQDK